MGMNKGIINDDILYFHTPKGCFEYNLKLASLDTFFYLKKDNAMGDNVVRTITPFKNSIYLQTDNGTYIVNVKTKKYSHVKGTEKFETTKLAFFDSTNYWFINDDGAIKYFKNKITKYNLNNTLDECERISGLYKNNMGGKSILLHKSEIKVINRNNNFEDNHDCYFSGLETKYPDSNVNLFGLKSHNFAPHCSEFKFNIEVPSYNNSEDILYYYKLSSLNNNWIINSTPNISYYSLPHGNYTFQAKALMPDGQFTNTIQYKFTIRTPWNKSWWFYSLCVLGIGSIIYGAAKYRINQIKEKEKLKAEFGAKIIESELGALRAQMNPHFIFNSLNSINSFIVSNKGEQASNYLGDFSRLIRLILANSKNETISLAQEIETLEYYLKLESLRFKDKFTYSIIYHEDLPISIIKIPPMIVQPYIENAIWHGLMNKEDNDGKVIITFDLSDEDDLVATIIDNGIGRVAAKQYKSESLHKNKSYGMLITEERLQLIQEKFGKKASVIITDLYNNKQQAQGTNVTIKIANNL